MSRLLRVVLLALVLYAVLTWVSTNDDGCFYADEIAGEVCL